MANTTTQTYNNNTEVKNNTSSSSSRPSTEKELNFSDNLVAKIIGMTSQNVSGIVNLEGNVMDNITGVFKKDNDPKAGVNVDIDDDHNRVKAELKATMKYGVSAPEVFEKVVDEITRNIKKMTGMGVSEIKMTVEDMLTDKEIEQNKSKNSDNKD